MMILQTFVVVLALDDGDRVNEDRVEKAIARGLTTNGPTIDVAARLVGTKNGARLDGQIMTVDTNREVWHKAADELADNAATARALANRLIGGDL